MGTEPRPDLLLDLTRRYLEPHRHYHALPHIATMLDLGRALPLSDAQVLAIWFHDAIYDPRRDDNEEQSARLCERLLPAAGHDAPTTALVARIVRDTRSHQPSIPEAAPVIDLDLQPLAVPWEHFCRNAAAIRAEYAHVPDDAFRTGRLAFLRTMLGKERIFCTPWGQQLEGIARQNLARAIAEAGG